MKPSSTHLEPLAPSQNKIAQRYSDIIINNFAVAFRGIIIAEYLHRSNNTNTWGICRNDDYALLLVSVRVIGVTLPQNKVKSASRISCPTNPPVTQVKECTNPQRKRYEPFMSIDDNLSTFLSYRGPDIGGI